MAGAFFDFGRQRDWKEALLFYAVIFLTCLSVSVVPTVVYFVLAKPGLLAAAITVPEAMDEIKKLSATIGLCFSVVSSVILSAVILVKKRLYDSAGFGLAALAVVLSFLGGVFGLVPIAVLTMRPRAG